MKVSFSIDVPVTFFSCLVLPGYKIAVQLTTEILPPKLKKWKHSLKNIFP